ncbi:MAG: helix-turn-helix domain-containing protein, partial [Nocardioidaceae bacterium]
MTTTDDHKTRPRVEGDREDEILEAALAVLAEVGYDRLTMDAVATAAKASKATLYRRWTSKAHLVVDAAVRAKGCPMPDDVNTGSLRGDLLAMSTCDGGLTDNVPM